MSGKRVLIDVAGFIGDCLFASSVAEPLRKQRPEIEYLQFNIAVEQPIELMERNPYIDKVTYKAEKNDCDELLYCGQVDQSIPATIQFQQSCGVLNPVLGYSVYTNPSYDYIAESYFAAAKRRGKKIVAFQANWKERTFGFTQEEYDKGVNTNDLGYGGRRRDTDFILSLLASLNDVLLVKVGYPPNTRQDSIGMFSMSTYSMTASIIKHCDFMIGAEGGLTNLAAGVGTKCIITSDFIWYLYGKNGFMRKIENPQMGPATYFPDGGHVHLDPFMADIQVAEAMQNIILGLDK